MTSAILTEADVAKLVDDLVGAGTRVIAPVPAGPNWSETEYRVIDRLDDALLDGTLPRRSLKEFLRPPQPEERSTVGPQVILGVRPCDAAGVETLENVMRLEYRNELWRARRAATTIVTFACGQIEPSCFCGAVGIGPDSNRGADAVLVPLEDATARPRPAARRIADQLRRCVDLFLIDSAPFEGAAELLLAEETPPPARPPMRWAARAVTLKGAALLRGRGQPLANPADRARAAHFARTARDAVARNLESLRLRRWPERLDAGTEARLGLTAADGGALLDASPLDPSGEGRLPEWLARNHDHQLWKTLAPHCRSCGNCSAVCATSPCFDVDEREPRPCRAVATAPAPDRASARALPTRTEHFRQRIMHKFSMHPRRFDAVLCTGCGRCSRACEGGLNLPEILGQLVQLAVPEPVRVTT